MLKSTTLLNVVLSRQGITILPFDEKNLDGDMEIIAGNAFRPDNKRRNCLCGPKWYQLQALP